MKGHSLAKVVKQYLGFEEQMAKQALHELLASLPLAYHPGWLNAIWHAATRAETGLVTREITDRGGIAWYFHLNRFSYEDLVAELRESGRLPRQARPDHNWQPLGEDFVAAEAYFGAWLMSRGLAGDPRAIFNRLLADRRIVLFDGYGLGGCYLDLDARQLLRVVIQEHGGRIIGRAAAVLVAAAG